MEQSQHVHLSHAQTPLEQQSQQAVLGVSAVRETTGRTKAATTVSRIFIENSSFEVEWESPVQRTGLLRGGSGSWRRRERLFRAAGREHRMRGQQGPAGLHQQRAAGLFEIQRKDKGDEAA